MGDTNEEIKGREIILRIKYDRETVVGYMEEIISVREDRRLEIC